MRLFYYCLFVIPMICLAQAPAPQMSIDATHHNFGKLLMGQKVTHRYKITNVGASPLRIIEARPSCGCSSAIVGQRLVGADESTFIEVRFDSAEMQGSIYKTVDIITNDEKNPSVALTFEASVVREVMANTSVISFKDVPRNGSASSTFRLESGTEQAIAVTSAAFNNSPYLTCTPQQDGIDVILNVTIDGRLIPKDKYRGVDVLTVDTTNRKYPTWRFNVQWDTPVAIAVSQNHILWTGPPGKEYRTLVTLKHSDGKPFKVLKATPTSSLIKVVGFKKTSATEHRFEVVLSDSAKPGMYSERLKFVFDDHEQRELEIAISAAIR